MKTLILERIYSNRDGKFVASFTGCELVIVVVIVAAVVIVGTVIAVGDAASFRSGQATSFLGSPPSSLSLFLPNNLFLISAFLAFLLNQIVCEFPPDHPLSSIRPVRKLLGHTPIQVVAGGILGCIMASSSDEKLKLDHYQINIDYLF
ncbi:hypothetical protein WN943_011084 [Citrus x changshan-huyou]